MKNRVYAENFQVDFKAICENLNEAIHISDEKGRVVFINKAYTHVTGIQPEDILGRTVRDIEKEGKYYHNSITDRILDSGKHMYSIATILKSDKKVLVTGIPVFDHSGKTRYVVTKIRDMTELKDTEVRLHNIQKKQEHMKAELDYLRQQQIGDTQIIYASEAMEGVIKMARMVALSDATVLITGETGTGKELIANEIHQKSHRRKMPFIKVNCGAIPADLLESELFGYESGAFTGARRSGKAGMFELANGGTIMLDEIGDMPMPLQVKLLRVLQQREIMRLGGNTPIKLDVRVIASTNKNLWDEVQKKTFREDLFFRLNVVPIHIPPLRKRKEDIPAQAGYFCENFSRKYEKNLRISNKGMRSLMEYSWPGNTRELENLMERIVVTTPPEDEIVSPTRIYMALNPQQWYDQEDKTVSGGGTLKERVNNYEKQVILRMVRKKGSIRKAALALGVDHSTLVKKCQNYRREAEK